MYTPTHDGGWRTAGLGGMLWIAYYSAILGSGLGGKSILGTEPQDSPLTLAAWGCFVGALACFNLTLVALWRRLSGRSAWFGRAGLLFTWVAGTLIVGSLAALLGLVDMETGMLAGFGVMTTCVATTLIGIAVRRERALAGGWRNLPLIVGALTFPLIVGFGAFGAYVPAYVTDELPFAISGLGWLAIGVAMRRGTAHAAARQVWQTA